ncbi:glycoside hydrolase 100 family protein [Gemmatimonas phototrophica]|uniref:beta-fructofuranosidase n=1 Tax=Gemmatimonas phototrophica TaxID=1379270 RepID=A0A143BG93_9BACT|nr:glycoside hydrolase 100 family protein [Gemmatimonas phototrophica]AMW04058.1 hypothetical protein GEMMAAP_02810 [Gemmatimonas phototrophica]
MKDDLPLNDSITLLRELATPLGIRASRSSVANYAAIFARDAIMAGLAGLTIGDAPITAGLVRTLEHLRDLQGPQGQIASNFRVEADDTRHVSFGTLAPRFDSATWFLVGVGAACQHGQANFEDYRAAVTRVIALLDGIEYNGRHLLYVPAGGNWADEYPFDGYILYDQVLRAWGLRLLGTVANEPAWVAKAEAIGHTIAERFWPAGDWQYGGARRFPVAAISPVRTDEHVDLAACALLALSDLVPDRTTGILDAMRDTFLNANALPPAFSPVIAEGDPDWEPLARYHLHGFRNRPHEYHNGGIWPVWLGWLALAFARHGRPADVATLHALTAAHLARLSHFDFEEYFHGVTGEALGTQGMAYTATGFVFLETARFNQVDLPWTR